MSASGADGPRVPVTLLTGFLGSGKTSLLNHLLSADHGRRLGVIVNEFGELSVDDRLLANSPTDLVTLPNGCVCCTLGGDLVRALEAILAAGDVEHVVVETTGIADPARAGAGLMRADAGDVRLSGYVCLVDPVNFDRNLDAAEVAYNQLVHADVLLLNKVDVASAELLCAVEGALRKLNAHAEIHRCVRGAVDWRVVLDAERTPAGVLADTADASTSPHALVAGLETVAFRSDDRMDRERFLTFLRGLPDSVIRAKGFVSFADSATPEVLQYVSGRWDLTEEGRVSDQIAPGTCELVLIGADVGPLVSGLRDARATRAPRSRDAVGDHPSA